MLTECLKRSWTKRPVSLTAIQPLHDVKQLNHKLMKTLIKYVARAAAKAFSTKPEAGYGYYDRFAAMSEKPYQP